MTNHHTYSEGMLKGRMAETLVEELLMASGNKVYRFGYEAIVQNLVQLEKSFDKNSEVGQRIRAIPDFIVIDGNGNPKFIEVKFRWKPELLREDLERLRKIQKFWDSSIVFVNCWERPYFRISHPPYTNGKGKLNLKPLINEGNWNIKEKIHEEVEDLVYRYLTPTLIPPKK